MLLNAIAIAAGDLFPLSDVYATMLIINPTAAKGIFNQLSEPKQGINPIRKPINAKIPHIKLKICINYFL